MRIAPKILVISESKVRGEGGGGDFSKRKTRNTDVILSPSFPQCTRVKSYHFLTGTDN